MANAASFGRQEIWTGRNMEKEKEQGEKKSEWPKKQRRQKPAHRLTAPRHDDIVEAILHWHIWRGDSYRELNAGPRKSVDQGRLTNRHSATLLNQLFRGAAVAIVNVPLWVEG